MFGVLAVAQESSLDAAGDAMAKVAEDVVLFGMSQSELIVAAICGIIAGFIANLLLGGGGGLIRYLIAGVLGGFVAQAILAQFGIDHLWGYILQFGDGRIPSLDGIPFIGTNIDQIVDSTFGALVVIIFARFLAGGGD